jgi:hypothetical protein
MLGKSFMTPRHVARPAGVREPFARASMLRRDRHMPNPRPAVGALGDCLDGDSAPEAGKLGAGRAPDPSPQNDA